MGQCRSPKRRERVAGAHGMTPSALRSLLSGLLFTGILLPSSCLGRKGGGGSEGRVESVDPREVSFSHAKIYGTFS